MNIVLDPSLIWFNTDGSDDFQYLCEVVEFIDRYLELKYLVSWHFVKLLYRISKDPMEGYRESEQRKQDIIHMIWKGIDIDSIQDLEKYSPTVLPAGFELPERADLKQYLNEIFGYAESENAEILFFLALNKQDWNGPCYYSIKYVRHIFRELESHLAVLISNGTELKKGCLRHPSHENPLPNPDLCKEYSKMRTELIRTGKGDIPNYKKIGKEVAFRNGYRFNDYLTRINNSAIRDIYSTAHKPIIHLSTDTEHGAFEAFDESGVHLGEFSYEGKQTKKPSPVDHKIILKR